MEKWTGKTVEIIEENHYNDSDWIATYWNGEEFVQALCGTTRYCYPLSAHIDAPQEIIALWQAKKAQKRQDEIKAQLEKEAAEPQVGKKVMIIKGRKHINKEGVIFWRGANKYKTYYANGYNRPEDNQIIGVKTAANETFFVPIEYGKVIH